jgi:hypothetical protein
MDTRQADTYRTLVSYFTAAFSTTRTPTPRLRTYHTLFVRNQTCVRRLGRGFCPDHRRIIDVVRATAVQATAYRKVLRAVQEAWQEGATAVSRFHHPLSSRVTELRPKGNISPTRPRAAGTHEREPNPVSLSAVRSRIWKMSAVLNVSHCFLMLYEARRLTLVVVGLLATWNSPRVLAQLFALW